MAAVATGAITGNTCKPDARYLLGQPFTALLLRQLKSSVHVKYKKLALSGVSDKILVTSKYFPIGLDPRKRF